MRSILFEIHTVTWLQALIVGLVVATGAVVWAWLEKRASRLTDAEFRLSLVVGVGAAVVAAVGLFFVSRLVPSIPVRSYGVMLMFAFGAGIVLGTQRARMYRVDPAHIVDLSLFILLASIIGSRVLYVALNWEQEYAANPRLVLNVWEGGLSFYGGLIGGSLATLLFCRWRHLRLSVLADLLAPSIAFGYSIARLGCFLNGCCYGGPTSLPWGVCFPGINVPGPVHPTQLYSAFAMWVVGVALLLMAPRIRVPGHLLLWYLVLSSVERIVNEAFRRPYTAQPWSVFPALTQAQAFSVALILIAGITLVMTWKRVGYPLAAGETAGDRSQVTGDREQPRRRPDRGTEADEEGPKRERARDRRRRRK